MKNFKKGFVVPIVIAIIAVLAIGGGIYYSKNKTKTSSVTEESVTLEKNAQKTDWKTYNSPSLHFSIKYPSKLKTCTADGGETFCEDEWVYEESQSGVAFGTKSSKIGGWLWSVSVFQKSKYNKEAIIKDVWSHMTDRKEKRADILINGKSATLVTITSDSFPGTEIRDVFIETGTDIYMIGGNSSPEFETFYKSFDLI